MTVTAPPIMFDPPRRRRPEIVQEPIDASGIGDVQRQLAFWERLLNNQAFRRVLVLAVLLVTWEAYARWADSPLLFPTFSETARAFLQDLLNGTLLDRTLTSLRPLALGYAGGLVLAGILTTFAVLSRVGADVLSTLTSMFNPLPAIALLPLALMWFGLGTPSLVFVIIHSVLWAVALNTLTGFRSVPETLRLSGRNCGLRGVRYVAYVLVPAAFPAILTGLKIGWAFAWRTLVAAELVFGVSSRSGGLGWYVFEARAEMDTPKVFAGLFSVILIGLLVESVIFRAIEYRTVQRWGMQN
ncbi:MAG: ssuC 6 [Tardiphaga sp.]|jgi:NitT/TauT family transport system permease protein|nr:ssuC 6 [Tardiphaga sp.]